MKELSLYGYIICWRACLGAKEALGWFLSSYKAYCKSHGYLLENVKMFH